jgi:hypothetical protein
MVSRGASLRISEVIPKALMPAQHSADRLRIRLIPSPRLILISSRRDTAGQERFHSLTNLFLKGANMVILVYDLTRADSFDALNLWRDQFLSSTRNDPATFPFAVLANKSDMAANRAVSQRKANNWYVPWSLHAKLLARVLVSALMLLPNDLLLLQVRDAWRHSVH